MRLAEVEATIACLALGLDPAMGQAHAVRQGRPAASLDLMEAVRGVVEECVLTLIRDLTVRKAWFFEAPDGEVRLRPPLSHELADVLLPILRESVAAPAERIASMIAEAAEGEVKVPTVLSSERRGKARRPRRPKFSHHCHGCGVAMPEHQRHRAWCDLCLPTARTERGLSTVGPARRRKRPARSDYGRKQDYRRAESMAAVRAAEQDWERQHAGMARPLPSEFAPIREALLEIPLQRISEAIGVSQTAASKIRSGKLVPHLRHWEALSQMATNVHSEATLR